MLFQQFVDDDLGCASYLIGDEEAGVAAIVDPPYAIEPVLAEAARREVRIVRTIETHTHADHLSGHGRLALEHGLPISIHPAAEAAYEHDPLEDGAEITLGAVVLRAIHTPGHRPEHTCIAVIDRSRADEPWLVLTGDSLFVGDAARPDLAVGAQEGAEQLFHSLRRLLELPDGVEVFPGHVAGSLCGKAMSSKGSSTIGFERRFNHALQIEHEADFVADSASVSAPKPPNMTRLVELNRGPHVGAAAEVVELPIAPAGATRARRPPRARVSRRPWPRGAERARLRHVVRDQGRLPARRVGADRDPGVERGRSRACRRAVSAPSASSSSRATCSETARSGSKRSASTSSTS